MPRASDGLLPEDSSDSLLSAAFIRSGAIKKESAKNTKAAVSASSGTAVFSWLVLHFPHIPSGIIILFYGIR